jgi:hypothetical protein
MLLQTRFFDLLVLSLIRCNKLRDANALQAVPERAATLYGMLLVLERKPYQRGKAFVFLSVVTQCLGAPNGVNRRTEEFCTESPGADCTSTMLSAGMLEQMCRSLVDTDKRHIISYSYKICNIATALNAVMLMSGDQLAQEHRDACFKILSYLTETHDEIAPEIGLEWSASLTAPHYMYDDANLESNLCLGKALEENPMLRDALANGRLHFTADDWQDMSAKQGLFVPVNSLVYQRGLSDRGTVQIGSVYFRPVARGSMHSLLGCQAVLIVLQTERATAQVIRSRRTSSVEEYNSEDGVLFKILLFVESMLDQIMDVECGKVATDTQTLVLRVLECILTQESTGTMLLQLTCHILDQFMRKLHIPARSDLTDDALEWQIVKCGIDSRLFWLLRSSPQATEHECLICFYACTVLMDMHKIRAVRYSETLGRSVDAALFVTRKNIRNETGYLAAALLEEMTKLRACCEQASAPSSSLGQVLRSWRFWTG